MSGAEEVLVAVRRLVEDDGIGARLTVTSGAGAGMSALYVSPGGIMAGALPDELGEPACADAEALLERETPATVSYGDRDLFIDPLLPRPRLVIFGAVHIGQALSEHASLLGYRVTVSDARPAFLNEDRFPRADQLAVGWPDEVADDVRLDRRTSVVVLSHDARFEDPLWPILLPSPVRYIGAMGSSRTASRRRRRLLEAGFAQADVDRIHGPVGLDIGADSANEVAIAILAEMISEVRRPGERIELTGELRPLERVTG